MSYQWLDAVREAGLIRKTPTLLGELLEPAPYSSLSSAYQDLLGQLIYAANPTTITVELDGLVDGQSYAVQWWTNDSLNTVHSFVTASGVSDVTLDSNTSDDIGGVGQYVIGTFTANASLAFFTLTGSPGPGSGSGFPMISALQLRTVEAVPEPSTWVMGLAGIACAGWQGFRRRRAR